MTHEACESKLRLVVRSSMHPYPGNCVAIGHAVVYYDWAAHEFSDGMKCRHCILTRFPWLSGAASSPPSANSLPTDLKEFGPLLAFFKLHTPIHMDINQYGPYRRCAIAVL